MSKIEVIDYPAIEKRNKKILCAAMQVFSNANRVISFPYQNMSQILDDNHNIIAFGWLDEKGQAEFTPIGFKQYD